MTEIAYIISRLEEALEKQEEQEGEIARTPSVCYCFDCDVIVVDSMVPGGCGEHRTVSADGYEHDGISSALTALEYIEEP